MRIASQPWKYCLEGKVSLRGLGDAKLISKQIV